MSKHSNRTRVLVAGAVTTAVALTGAGYGVASAAQKPADVRFVAATRDVVAERFVDGDSAYFQFDLGVNIIAGAHPLEIRAARTSYAQPVVAKRLVVGAGGKKTWEPLPKGMFTTFDGFEDFTSVVIKDNAGKTVKKYNTDFCPNTYDSARTRRDAPAETPYPTFCAGGNPFTLGSVWGVQAGWSARTESMPRFDFEDGGDPEFDLAAGSYKVTVTLNKKYRDYLRVPASAAVANLNLKVVDVDAGPGGEDLARARALTRAAAKGDRIPPETAAAGEHGEHGGQGDPQLQAAPYTADLRPPARAPRALAAAPKSGPRPDLRSLPAWGIQLEQAEDGKTYVNFAATVWNAGSSPLVVDGFRRTGEDVMDAYQYFFDAKGKQVGSIAAGTMEWDSRDGHLHWHFTDFAQYNLLRADKKLAVRSGKEAFCLANTDAVDYTIPNAKWRPGNTDLASACGQNTAVAVREVLDIGNGDTYAQYLPGQSFDVTGLPNGTYYVETLANPDKKLAESNTKNNSSLRKIVLGGTPKQRTLQVPAVYGLDGPQR